MVRVTSKYGESIEKLIQRFKRACNKEGVLKELKRREAYEKPSERRRRKFKERMKNIRKAEQERIENPTQSQSNQQ